MTLHCHQSFLVRALVAGVQAFSRLGPSLCQTDRNTTGLPDQTFDLGKRFTE